MGWSGLDGINNSGDNPLQVYIGALVRQGQAA